MSRLLKKIKIWFTVFGIFVSDPKMFLSFLRNLILLQRQRKNIVVSLTEHIGDLVAAEPISRHVKEANKDKKIIWVVHKKYVQLIRNNPFIDDLITVTCFSEWILLRKLTFGRHWVDLHLDRKVCDKHQLLYKREIPIDINNYNYYEKGNLLFCFSRSAGLNIDSSIAPKLYFQKKRRRSFLSIVVHSSSNHSKRKWTKEGWNETANYIVSRFSNVKIIEIGFESMIDIQSSPYINYCGQKELSDIAELIENCSLFIGVDSGFAHFANAMEKESLILIGTYNGFKNYMPYSGKFQKECQSQIYYTSKELSQLKFDEIKPELEKKLHWITPGVPE